MKNQKNVAPVDCPKCNVAAGLPCRGPYGRPANVMHGARARVLEAFVEEQAEANKSEIIQTMTDNKA